MTSPDSELHELSAIQQFVDLVGRRWRWLLGGTVLGMLVAAALTASTPDVYEARSRLYVNIPAAQGIQEALQGVQLSAQLLASYAEIAESRAVAADVSEALDGELSTDEVLDQLSVGVQPPTLLLSLDARSSSPETAARLADAAALALVDQVEELEAERADPIQAQVIDVAVIPSSPVEPRPSRNVALGLVFGLIGGFAAAVAAQSLDRSVGTIADAEAASRAPVLGVVPRDSGLVGDRTALPDSAAGEAFRSLRTSVRFAAIARDLDTLLITSASAQEGKSTVVANLARVCAADGLRVVVVDADLRRPVLHEVFDVEPGPGLVDVLAGEASLSDVLVEVGPSLRLLQAGPIPERPTELLGEQRMRRLLEQLSLASDLVIVDSAPVQAVTDAVVVAAVVDAVGLVARARRTDRRQLAEARNRLDVVGARVLGCVMTDVRGRNRQYYTYRPLE